jgi:hypothetical protein
MKTEVITALALAGAAQATVQGFDISHYQTDVNYQGAYNAGARFVMIKASSPLSSFEPHTTRLTRPRPPKEQLTPTPPSPPTTRAPPTPA